MPNLIVGIDPASTKVAFFALHPLPPTVLPIKIVLGRKYGPDVAGRAFDETLASLDKICSMASRRVSLDPGERRINTKMAFLEFPVVGRGGVRSSLVQAFTSGVVQACLVKTGFTVYMVNQSQWKTWLTGRAQSDKDTVLRSMKGKYPKDVQACGGDGDLLDAAALARYGYETIRRSSLVASVRGM